MHLRQQRVPRRRRQQESDTTPEGFRTEGTRELVCLGRSKDDYLVGFRPGRLFPRDESGDSERDRGGRGGDALVYTRRRTRPV